MAIRSLDSYILCVLLTFDYSSSATVVGTLFQTEIKSIISKPYYSYARNPITMLLGSITHLNDLSLSLSLPLSLSPSLSAIGNWLFPYEIQCKPYICVYLNRV